MRDQMTEWPAVQMEQVRRRANGVPDFVKVLREESYERFLSQGFPTPRMERWRFTDFSGVSATPWGRAADHADGGALAAEPGGSLADGWRLVLINGRFSAGHSQLPAADAGVEIGLLSACSAELLEAARARLIETAAANTEPLALLNTALMEEVLLIRVAAGRAVEKPIEVHYHVDAPEEVAVHPRLLIFSEARSSATVIETYGGADGARYFVNPAVDVVIAAGARLDHYSLQQESRDAAHVANTRATLGRDAVYHRWALDFGGGLARHDLIVEMDGEGAEANLYGLYMPAQRQHVDHHLTLRHLQPHTFSRQLYKGILQDKAHSVFNGRIYVAQAAQRTDAIQHNKNLLLSDAALADSQPQLEIFADDVRCTHGGTIGQLNRDGLFYLQSRGIGAETARRIMVHAFAGEVVESVRNMPLRAQVERWMSERLGAEDVGGGPELSAGEVLS